MITVTNAGYYVDEIIQINPWYIPLMTTFCCCCCCHGAATDLLVKLWATHSFAVPLLPLILALYIIKTNNTKTINIYIKKNNLKNAKKK